ADAEAQGMAGIGDVRERAVDEDLAAVGGVKAIQDRHERRFAGTILADNTVDRATLNLQVDVAIGVDRTEALVDLPKFDGPSRSSGHAGPLLGCTRVVVAQSSVQRI